MTDIHPVLRRVLARRGLAGAPQDGRKITLVLFGGIMNAVRGAAALVAFEELGLRNAFDEIYTMSSGFANSCYFLAGQAQQGAAAYYTYLAGTKFLKLYRPWRLADLDYLMRLVKDVSPVDVDALYRARTKLYTMVTKSQDLNAGVFLELRDVEQSHFYDLFRACSSLPVVAKGFVRLNGEDYRDVFYDEALRDFMQKVLSTDATDVVVVYNYAWQRSYVRSMVDMDRAHVVELMPPFFAGMPEWLQKLTRLETRPRTLKRQAQEFGDAVKKALGSNEAVRLL